MSEHATAENRDRNQALLSQGRKALSDGNFDRAMQHAREVLADDPEQEEALYLLAVSQRYAGQVDQALTTLEKLQSLKPDYGRAVQEAGHCHLAKGQPEAAINAFRRAVERNNSLIASWNALARLLQPLDVAAAAQASEQHRRLAALPKELLGVRNMIAEGRPFVAEQVCRKFLRQNPKHVEGMRLLADLGVRAGVLDDAEFLLESALEFEPENRFARHDYVQVLYRRQKYAQSLAEAKSLLDAEPDNLDYRVSYANQCVAVSDYDTALQIYDYAVGRVDDAHALHLLRGHALKTIGQLEPAIEAYRHAYRDRSDFGDAYWSLANLKTYEFSAEEVDRMSIAEAAETTTSEDRIHLCFALGTHYERQADHESAMRHYERGNRLKKEELRYDADRMSKHLNLQIDYCDPELFESKQTSGCASPDPIFIVGMPRAGSTLLEQILASHSEVDGTFELPNIPALAFRLSGRRNLDEEPRYPAVLPELTPQQLKQFGESFLEDTKIHRKGAPRFIDKMPNNFRHLGLISLILPNARIIDARREPMACCFSGFKQLFSSGQEFTYGLREVGQYYSDYVRLMAHWDEVLPGKVLRVNYEDTVADLETQVRRILEFCELPYEQACVDFHQTRRSIRTPSSEQVRQPIYTSGLEYWRQFDPWLEPLREALGDLVPS